MIRRCARRASRASVAIEFAFVAPVLVALILGTAELGRYIFLRLKLADICANMGDLVARGRRAEAAEIDQILSAGSTMLEPFAGGPRIRIYVTAVIAGEEADDPPVVAWRTSAGALAEASRLGAVGGQVLSIDDALLSNPGDGLIVTEIFYEYSVWLGPNVAAHVIAERAVHRPRRGALAALE